MNQDTTIFSSDIGQLIEPENISFSFNTLGWKMVGLLILVCFLLAIVLWWRHYRKNEYRRTLIKQINYAFLDESTHAPSFIDKIIKRTCLDLYGREKVAALYGEAWFTFLDTTMPTGHVSKTYYDLFTRAIYDRAYNMTPGEISEFRSFMLTWADKHHANV